MHNRQMLTGISYSIKQWQKKTCYICVYEIGAIDVPICIGASMFLCTHTKTMRQKNLELMKWQRKIKAVSMIRVL